MAVFLVLIIAMAIRIALTDSYIHRRREFIGEESINIFVYTLGTAFYMNLVLEGKIGINKSLQIISMLLVFFLYIFFIYLSCLSLKEKKHRERKKKFYRTMEYVAIGLLVLFLPLIMVYPLIDIAVTFLYNFEQKELN